MYTICKIFNQKKISGIKTSVISYPYLIQFILVFIISSSSVNSQQTKLPFENITIEEGLPTLVTSILQDRTGYLWFATWSGLYKYDGYTLVSYKHDTNDTTSLTDNTLTTLYEDKEGTLWIGTYLGLERFDREKKSFIHYMPHSPTETEAGNYIFSIFEDRYGILWIGTGDGLNKFDRNTGKFICLRSDITDPSTISRDNVNAIHEDKTGSLWFGTGNGLDKFDRKTGNFIHYWLNPYTNNEWSEYWINTIFEDKEGILWLGTRKGIIAFNQNDSSFTSYLNEKVTSISSISEDLSGNIWFGTWESGLFSFDKNSKKITNYLSDDNDKNNDITITSVCCERSGTLWIGTKTGIKKLNRIKLPFKTYPMDKIASAIVNWGKGILWVFEYNKYSWLKFDINKEQFVPYSFGDGHRLIYFYPGELIISNEKGGLYKEDTLGNISPFIDDSLKDYIKSITFGCKTQKGYYHGTLTGGFYFQDPKTNHITKIRDLKLEINLIYEDSFGLLWITTFMGTLFSYDPESDKLVEYNRDSKNISGISAKLINQIYEDKKGRLWFATNFGLNLLDRSRSDLSEGQANFIHFTKKDGLPGDDIRGILEDDHGHLWLNTTKGISKFDPDKIQFKNYDVSYGLKLTANLFYGHGAKTENGEMYFPSVTGITRFHPDSIKDNAFVPPIVITSFRKMDKICSFTSGISLPYDDNFLTFEFAAMSFINSERKPVCLYDGRSR